MDRALQCQYPHTFKSFIGCIQKAKLEALCLHFIHKASAEEGAPATGKPRQEVGKEREVTRKERDTLQQQDA